jgi:hypothetical protein
MSVGYLYVFFQEISLLPNFNYCVLYYYFSLVLSFLHILDINTLSDV